MLSDLCVICIQPTASDLRFVAEVSSECWPDKFDLATGLEMLACVEKDVETWLGAVKLRRSALGLTKSSARVPGGMCRVNVAEAVLFVANYTAPSLIKADVSLATLKLVSTWITTPQHSSQAMGLMLSPCFSYKPGQLLGLTDDAFNRFMRDSWCLLPSPCCPLQARLFNEEYSLLKTLSNSGLQVDSGFQLLFDVASKTEA